MKLSKHFSRHEFLCKGNIKGICKCDGATVDVELLELLEDLREHFENIIKIYSGYRCPRYNKYVGGVNHSRHMQGIASDVHIPGISPYAVYKYLDKKYPEKYGIGLYKTFTHIDVRSHRARWGK